MIHRQRQDVLFQILTVASTRNNTASVDFTSASSLLPLRFQPSASSSSTLSCLQVSGDVPHSEILSKIYCVVLFRFTSFLFIMTFRFEIQENVFQSSKFLVNLQSSFFNREGMKAKKRVTVLVFSVILTFIGRSNCNVETDCDNLTFLTNKWSTLTV